LILPISTVVSTSQDQLHSLRQFPQVPFCVCPIARLCSLSIVLRVVFFSSD
jgi:hypothetical protein